MINGSGERADPCGIKFEGFERLGGIEEGGRESRYYVGGYNMMVCVV